MTVSEAIADALDNVAPLAGGWHPGRLARGAVLPAGVYQRISTVRAMSHSGHSAWAQRRIQATIYSERYAEGLAAAIAIVAALGGTRTDLSGFDTSSMVMDEAEDVDPEPRGLFRQRIDLMWGSEHP